MAAIEATPAKLRNGDWGARTKTRYEKGQVRQLDVKTKAGKTWTATHKCIAGGDGWALWAKVRETRGYGHSGYNGAGAHDGDFCGPRCGARNGSTCLECGA